MSRGSVRHHLAQVNVALARTPLDSPEMAGFMALLEPVNALADEAPGFVWRLQTDDGDATAIRVFDEDRFIVNMSVWESPDALWSFVYDSGHLDVMRRRREWFGRLAEAHMALWWLPAGQVPTVDEAEQRLAHIRRLGPTPYAFDLKHRFPPPGSRAAHVPLLDERVGCPG